MGERKGTNKYYPPDFDPKKHGSLAGYHGQHPLRERASKMHLGILVIRFEMPYNIWCGGCNNPIGMGVRYNAEKSKIGMYYTTPIYKFRMKCHLCDNYLEIKTDPANHDYVIISGARRKEQRWDPKENEQIVPEDRASQKKLATDAMYKLEHGFEDKGKSSAAFPGIIQIEKRQALYKDDYMLNKLARKKFRSEKKAIKETTDNDEALLAKSSLDMDLVAEHSDDVRLAKLMKYDVLKSFSERQKLKREEIEKRPLFNSSHSAASSSTSSNTIIGTTCSSTFSSPHNIRKMASLERKSPQTFNQGKSTPLTSSVLGISIVKKAKSSSEVMQTKSFEELYEDILVDKKEQGGVTKEEISEANPSALNSLLSSYNTSSSDSDSSS